MHDNGSYNPLTSYAVYVQFGGAEILIHVSAETAQDAFTQVYDNITSEGRRGCYLCVIPWEERTQPRDTVPSPSSTSLESMIEQLSGGELGPDTIRNALQASGKC